MIDAVRQRPTADEVKLAKGLDMMRTLVWKEYREHRAVWALMTLLGVGLFAVIAVMAHARVGLLFFFYLGFEAWCSLALLLVALYGIVCAAMMLAGERESGTMAFLDSLSSSRTAIWKTKLLTGAFLIALQTVLIGLPLIYVEVPAWLAHCLAGVYRATGGTLLLWDFITLLALAIFALSAFAWTLLFSARGRTVLGAVGYSVLSLCLIWVVAALTLWYAGFGAFAFVTALGLGVPPAAAALFGSWWIYAGGDIERESAGVGIPAWLTLLWLTRRQARQLLVPLVVLGVVFGLALPWLGPISWPLGTVLMGVICGSAVFGGEQSSGWRRFLSDQRLPTIWVWSVKTGLWLLLAVLSAALAMVVALVSVRFIAYGAYRYQDWISGFAQEDWEGLSVYEISNAPQHLVGRVYYAGPLLLWITYGFACGLVSTILARKTIVALIIAFLLGVLLLAAWVPSLAAGGVDWWQLAGLPVLGFVISYLLTRDWASDQIHDRRAMLSLATAGSLTVLWLAGNFAYRAFQLPNLPPPFDLKAYYASLPKGEANEAARLIFEAVHELPEREKLARDEVGPLTDPPFPDGEHEGERWGDPSPTTGRTSAVAFSYLGQLHRVLQRGWPTTHAETLGRWLDLTCRGKWLKQIREAAALPLGVIEDRTMNHMASAYAEETRYAQLALVLAARAVQLQARGEARLGLDHLIWALAYSRNLRHRSVMTLYRVGDSAESTAFTGLYQWLNHRGLDPAVLRAALAQVQHHIAALPPIEESKEADYALAASTLADPSKVAVNESPYGQDELAIEVGIMADTVPWERERYRRILNYLYAHRNEATYAARGPVMRVYRDARLVYVFGIPVAPFRQVSPEQVALRRVSELMVALVLYEAEHDGKPAPSLESLVPRYLQKLPLDPTSVSAAQPDEQPFVYSISKEGWILPSQTFTGIHELVRVSAGRGLIETAGGTATGTFVVPPWPATKGG